MICRSPNKDVSIDINILFFVSITNIFKIQNCSFVFNHFSQVAIGSTDGSIQVYDINKTLTKSFQAHNKQSVINRLVLLSNTSLIASISDDKTISVWSTIDWSLKLTYAEHTGNVFALALLSDDSLLGTIASGGSDMSIHVWFLRNGSQIKTFSVNETILTLLYLGGDILAQSGDLFGHINVWNLRTSTLEMKLVGHNDSVNDMILLDGGLMASASDDQSIIIWDLTTKQTIHRLFGHTMRVHSLKVVGFNLMASTSADSTIRVWNWKTGEALNILTSHTGPVECALDVFSQDGTLISASLDRTVRFWNVNAAQSVDSLNVALTMKALVVLEMAGRLIFLFIDISTDYLVK